MPFGRQIDSINFRKHARGKEFLYPFFYSLINNTARFDDGGNSPDLNNPRFIPIVAGGKIDVPIKLDDDSVFRLHYIKFSVGDTSNNLGVGGVTNPPRPTTQTGNFFFARQVDMQMFAESSGARELIVESNIQLHFGGQNQGMSMVKHPFLFPKSGLVNLTFLNKNNVDVRIDGFIFGYKVQY